MKLGGTGKVWLRVWINWHDDINEEPEIV